MLDGCVLGKLSNAGIDTNYFYGVTQPFYFIADSSADSGTVNIRVGKIEMNQQNRSLNNNNNNTPESDNPVSCANVSFLENLYANGIVVVGNECNEEIVVCDNFDVQVFDNNSISVLKEYQTWEWIDREGNTKSTNVGNACKFNQPSGCSSVEFGKTYVLPQIGDYAPNQIVYKRLDDMKVKTCLDKRLTEHEYWQFKVENIRVPIFVDFCDELPVVCGWVNLGDGTDGIILSNYIVDCKSYKRVISLVDWWWEGAYHNESRGIQAPYKAYFRDAVLPHENIHLDQLKIQIPLQMNGPMGLPAIELLKLNKEYFECPEDALNDRVERIKELLNNALSIADDLKTSMGTDPNTGQPWSEIYADIGARAKYDTIRKNIKNWAKQQNWWNSNNPDCGN
jgi:hypothetical protein